MGTVALLIGMTSASSIPNVTNEEAEIEGPGWEYFVFGKIKDYEIIDYNGTEFLSCKAIKVRFLVWNISEKHPRLILPMKIRFNQEFNIPYEGSLIIGPNLMGNCMIIAIGNL